MGAVATALEHILPTRKTPSRRSKDPYGSCLRDGFAVRIKGAPVTESLALDNTYVCGPGYYPGLAGSKKSLDTQSASSKVCVPIRGVRGPQGPSGSCRSGEKAVVLSNGSAICASSGSKVIRASPLTVWHATASGKDFEAYYNRDGAQPNKYNYKKGRYWND